MRNRLILLMSILLCVTCFSQNTSVERSFFGVQVGLLGVWIHNEAKLTNSIALRSEVGLDAGVYGTNSDSNGFFLTPALTAEPRWYYNLNKRSTKQKRTDGNTGNFISLKTTFHPDWFILSEAPNINVISDISIIPTWGIRRSISTHFNYELGVGLGYVFFLEDTSAFLNTNSSELTANIHIRLGYKF